MSRVGQVGIHVVRSTVYLACNCLGWPGRYTHCYDHICLVKSLPKTLCLRRIYVVLANPIHLHNNMAKPTHAAIPQAQSGHTLDFDGHPNQAIHLTLIHLISIHLILIHLIRLMHLTLIHLTLIHLIHLVRLILIHLIHWYWYTWYAWHWYT
jgi:hypothetical protein